MILALINKQNKWQNITAMSLMACAIGIYIFGLCCMRCLKRGGHKSLKKFLKDINGERKYKKSNIHWELEVTAGQPKLLLFEGNPNNGTDKNTARDRRRSRRSDNREKLRESIQRSQQREDYGDDEMDEELGVDNLSD